MRIRAIHRYFWPDKAPYASFLREMTSAWAARGDDVTVITAKSSSQTAPDAGADSVAVQRVAVAAEGGRMPGQLLNMALFPLGAAWRVLRGPKPDVVMCSTAPQVTLGVAVSLAAKARGAAFVYHCMDVHPEIGRVSGDFANPAIFRMLKWLDTATMRRADAVVVLSSDMRAAVVDRDARLADSVVVLNNFALSDERPDAPSPIDPPEPGVLRAVFTGNLGRFQGLGDLVASLDEVPDDVDVELVLMGEGKAQPEIEEAAANLRPRDNITLTLVPAGGAAEAKALMRSAHVGVVSLVPGIAKYAYPSKTATYAEQGLPLLVVSEGSSELASSTVEHGLGWAVPPGDRAAIAAAFVTAAHELRDGGLTARSARVASRFDQEFNTEDVLARWASLMDRVGTPSTSTQLGVT